MSHWLPFLLLSVWFGGLAERYDCRRLIQVAQGLFLLEATGMIRPHVRAVVAVLALLVGGVANLTSTSIGQTVVQLRAPVEQRGRVVGVCAMFGSGLRTGNGLTLAARPSGWGRPSRSAGSCWWRAPSSSPW